jgi:hypothetical protein
METTGKKARLIREVFGSGSQDEPVAAAGEAGTAAVTAVKRAQRGEKLGGPQGSPQQGYSATAVQRKKTKAERREENSRQWAEIQGKEMEEDRKRKQVWEGGRRLTGEEFKLAVQRQAGIGRPSEYTEAQGEAICAWIRQGKSLSEYCRQAGMGIETPYRWMRTYPEFRERYTSAQEDRADTLADQLLAVVDDLPQDATMEQVQIAKLRLEARKWIASKLRPTKWGDKQTIEHTGGGISINIGIPQRPAAPSGDVEDVTPR